MILFVIFRFSFGGEKSIWSEITNPVLNFPPNTHLLKVVQREKKKQQQQKKKVEETGERKKKREPVINFKVIKF